MLEQSTGEVPVSERSGEFVEDDDGTAAPHRRRLTQRRHTVTVPLPAQGSQGGSCSPAGPGVPRSRDWHGAGSEGRSWGRCCEFQQLSQRSDVTHPVQGRHRLCSTAGMFWHPGAQLLCSCRRWPHSQIITDLTNRDVREMKTAKLLSYSIQHLLKSSM